MDTTDLVHDPEENRVPLQKLRFLLGRFRGEGRYTKGTGVFYKETRGTWEAGGRFIGLRMNVTYPLADGRRDIHEAFVMVGAGSTLASFEAQAYTDGGIIMNYHLESVMGMPSLLLIAPQQTSAAKCNVRGSASLRRQRGLKNGLILTWGTATLCPIQSCGCRELGSKEAESLSDHLKLRLAIYTQPRSEDLSELTATLLLHTKYRNQKMSAYSIHSGHVNFWSEF